MLNKKLLDEILENNKKIIIVSKYFDKQKTQKIFDFFEKSENQKYKNIFLGVGENRIRNLEEKNLKRENVFFIGNIQSNDLKKICVFSKTIMSFFKIKHLIKANKVLKENDLFCDIFIQINLDDKKENGINLNDIESFFLNYKKENLENLNLVGIMGIGKYKFEKKEKENEIKNLILAKNLFEKLSKKKLEISFGTSIDYNYCLESKDIKFLRIGNKIF